MPPIRRCLMLVLTLLFAGQENFLFSQIGSTSALLPAFSLRDQHDHPHDLAFPQKKPVLLILVDRRGAEHIETWTQPLGPACSNQVTLLVVGDVSPIPLFLRARYKKNFQKTLPHSVLLDWRGELVKKLPFTPHVPNLFLANPQGEIVFQTSGVAHAPQIQEISSFMERLTGKNREKSDSQSGQN